MLLFNKIIDISGRSQFLIFVFLLFYSAIDSLWGGAWSQKKNGYYLKTSANFLYTNQEFNHLGEKVNILKDFIVYENTAFQDFSIMLYLEYGLMDWITIITDLGYKSLTSKKTETGLAYFDSRDLSITTSGFADLKLSGRMVFIENPGVVSLQTGVKIPLGYEKQTQNDGPTLGTGEVDGEVWLLLGKSLWPKPIYFTGGIGYRSKGGPNHDEYLYNAEVGYTLGNLTLKFTMDGVKNTSTPPDIYGQTVITPLPGGGGILPDILWGDQDYLKLMPGMMYKIGEKLGLQFDLINTTAGKNVISGTTYSFGIYLTR